MSSFLEHLGARLDAGSSVLLLAQGGTGQGSDARERLFGVFNPDFIDRSLEWLVAYGLTFLIGITVLVIVSNVVKAASKRVEVKVIDMLAHQEKGYSEEAQKRMKTLFAMGLKAAIVAIWLLGILVILKTLNVDITPIITAFGVFGLAISFGAQSLVKDVISGAFLLFENQIRVGDVVVINGTSGLVEEINLRTVTLRDLSGVVHVIPNGVIESTSNMTKDWSGAILEIGVAYKEDVDRVVSIMAEIGTGMRADEKFGPMIIEDLEIFGLDSFGDSSVNFKARFKTLPMKQWGVAREYRRRIKIAFDKYGIEIPFPHHTLYFGDASPAFEILMRQCQGDKLAIERKLPDPSDAKVNLAMGPDDQHV